MFERIVETAPGNRTLTEEERKELAADEMTEYSVMVRIVELTHFILSHSAYCQTDPLPTSTGPLSSQRRTGHRNQFVQGQETATMGHYVRQFYLTRRMRGHDSIGIQV